MNILHIAAHMGDGAGKAIGGTARIGKRHGDTHSVLLFEEPKKFNHIDALKAQGIQVNVNSDIQKSVENADVVIYDWWGTPLPQEYINIFKDTPARILLWAHKNGFYDPPLEQGLVDACDGVVVTTPFSHENPLWKDSALVYGCGDFNPAAVVPKTDYGLSGGEFKIGYVGFPGYKRFPKNACEYYVKTAQKIPAARFVFLGERDENFIADMGSAGLLYKCDFLGWVENAPEMMLSFDAFGYLLKPDIFATTENSLLEAMAAALPVVTPKDPLGKYIVGDAGLLTDGSDGFAQALKRLYDSRELRTRLGTAARQKVIAEYDADENYARLVKACGEAIKREKKAHNLDFK